jgi:hypothetical protein
MAGLQWSPNNKGIAKSNPHWSVIIGLNKPKYINFIIGR